MKLTATTLGVAYALWAFAPTAATAAEAKQNFVLDNQTGFEIKEVYVSPHRSNAWEEDVLGQETLDDGSDVKIRFNRRVRTCRWDLKVVYAVDGTDAVWSNINLCEISKIIIHYNKKNDKTTAEFE